MKKLSGRLLVSDTAILIYIGLATTIAHMLVSGNYGYFIDELYTIACSRHLSLAFVDIPPIAPALLALNTALFGGSLVALHILPSIFAGAAVFMTGLMARELGGGRTATLLAGLAAAFVPVWMALGSMYTYDFLDQFTIISLFYFVIRLIKRENPKTWLAIGAVAGLGVMTKPSMVFFITGIAVALLFTKHRKQYRTRWPWLGALVAFVIISPALVVQALNGFPIASYWAMYSGNQAVHVNPLEFIMMQVVGMNVILLPVWGMGLYYFLFNRDGKKYRLLGVIYCVLMVIFLATGAKMYMPIPLYAMLIAGGAVSIERLLAGKKHRFLLPVYTSVIVLTGVLQAPIFMPALPVDTLIKYFDTVGGAFGFKSVRLSQSQTVELPQYLYDRFDWDVLVNDVAGVYDSLPEAERANVTISSNNYGCAGAVDLLGGARGLPKAACESLNYYYFTRDNVKDGTWIVIDAPGNILTQLFGDVQLAKQSFSKYRQPHNTAIYICRNPKFSLEQAKRGIRYLDLIQ